MVKLMFSCACFQAQRPALTLTPFALKKRVRYNTYIIPYPGNHTLESDKERRSGSGQQTLALITIIAIILSFGEQTRSYSASTSLIRRRVAWHRYHSYPSMNGLRGLVVVPVPALHTRPPRTIFFKSR